MDVVTRPETPQLRYARALLAALGDRPDGDAMAGVPAVEALAVLEWATPPYPPGVHLDEDVPVTQVAAAEALAGAARVAVDAAEAGRIAQAAAALRDPVVW